MSDEKIKRIRELEEMMDVIIRAIPKEKEANRLYAHAAARTENSHLKGLLENLASEEIEHEKKLMRMLKYLKKELQALRED